MVTILLSDLNTFEILPEDASCTDALYQGPLYKHTVGPSVSLYWSASSYKTSRVNEAASRVAGHMVKGDAIIHSKFKSFHELEDMIFASKKRAKKVIRTDNMAEHALPTASPELTSNSAEKLPDTCPRQLKSPKSCESEIRVADLASDQSHPSREATEPQPEMALVDIVLDHSHLSKQANTSLPQSTLTHFASDHSHPNKQLNTPLSQSTLGDLASDHSDLSKQANTSPPQSTRAHLASDHNHPRQETMKPQPEIAPIDLVSECCHLPKQAKTSSPDIAPADLIPDQIHPSGQADPASVQLPWSDSMLLVEAMDCLPQVATQGLTHPQSQEGAITVDAPPPWSDLPPDIMVNLIMSSRLSARTVIALSGVCKGWRESIVQCLQIARSIEFRLDLAQLSQDAGQSASARSQIADLGSGSGSHGEMGPDQQPAEANHDAADSHRQAGSVEGGLVTEVPMQAGSNSRAINTSALPQIPHISTHVAPYGIWYPEPNINVFGGRGIARWETVEGDYGGLDGHVSCTRRRGRSGMEPNGHCHRMPPKLLLMAATQGNVSAMRAMAGICDADGQWHDGLGWWKKCAKAGLIEGQIRYGMALYQGWSSAGVDAENAHLWLQRAARSLSSAAGLAEQSNSRSQPASLPLLPPYARTALAHACTVLGYMAYDGEGGRMDTVQAVTWFKSAASAGSREAQEALGWMFNTGQYG